MARPIKKGIGYFPLDVDFLQDIKIRKIMRACGSAAPTILICLLGNIYRDEGYFMKWDEDTRFLVADDVGTSEASVEEVVRKAIQVGVFDQGLYDKYQILTSHGIQERYKKAAYQKTDSSINKDFSLIEVNHADIGVSNSGNEVNHAESTQSKEKKSKVNKTKKTESPAYAPDDLNFKAADYLWKRIKSNFPDMKEPNLQKWANEMRLMNERDHRSYVDIRKMIDWCTAHEFWMTNILSANKLRKQFDVMTAQMSKPAAGKRGKREVEPKWAKPDYKAPAEQQEVSPESQAEIDALLEKLKEGREEPIK